MSPSVCIFTGTRAEYGLLRPVIRTLREDSGDVFLLVSGSHMSETYGKTLQEIEFDAIAPIVTADIGLANDSPAGVCASMGRAMSQYGSILSVRRPDILLVLGDRYEAFCAVAAAVVQKLPVAHLGGGETTLGAIDEYFRNAMTTMSQLHFTSCEKYRQKVIQLGADPEHAWNVGALGVENARHIPVLPKKEVGEYLGITDDADWIVVTMHPETLGDADPVKDVMTLAAALENLAPLHIVFTGANADPGGKAINDWLMGWALKSPRHHFFMSLGVERYLNAARYAKAVVGNSSSGIIEIPSLHVPVLDVGNRQRGRERSKAVLHCACCAEEINKKMQILVDQSYTQVVKTSSNPYENNNISSLIAKYIKNFLM